MNELTLTNPTVPNSLEAVTNRVNRWMVYFSSFVLCAMAIMIFVDVVLRYFFNSPLAAAVEGSQLMEPWVIFLPFAYTLAVGGHVRVTLVTMRLPKQWQYRCDLVAYGIDFLFFCLLCWISFMEFAKSLAINEFMMAAIRLPWWLGKMAMPIGMFLIALQAMIQILAVIKRTGDRG